MRISSAAGASCDVETDWRVRVSCGEVVSASYPFPPFRERPDLRVRAHLPTYLPTSTYWAREAADRAKVAAEQAGARLAAKVAAAKAKGGGGGGAKWPPTATSRKSDLEAVVAPAPASAEGNAELRAQLAAMRAEAAGGEAATAEGNAALRKQVEELKARKQIEQVQSNAELGANQA